MTEALLFPGRAGELGCAAVKAALEAGIGANAAIVYGRICSLNGKPFWELRKNLGRLLGVSVRQVTRYFKELVDGGLIVNRPAPLHIVHPGAKRELPYRPWYKWAIGLPQLREGLKQGSREAYERWLSRFEIDRKQRVTRTKLGAILGSIISPNAADISRKPDPVSRPNKRWTIEEIDAELAKREPRCDRTVDDHCGESSRGPPDKT